MNKKVGALISDCELMVLICMVNTIVFPRSVHWKFAFKL